MAKKMKRDQLTAIGLVSAIARNFVQQRARVKSMQKASSTVPDPAERKEQQRQAKKAAKKNARKKPKDSRTPEQLTAAADLRRAELVETVERVKYDLDVPARARDLRDAVARELPSGWRGRTQALAASFAVLATGLGVIASAVVARLRRQ
jgi:hypothetical protein